MSHFSPKRRFLIALFLGLLAGIVCTWVTAQSVPDVWGTALMWTIVTNRMLIGLVIGLAGAFTHHPIFGFPIPWTIRGLAMGIFVSLSLAFGAVSSGSDTMIFFATLLAGGFYGILIDFAATQWGGEGKGIAN